jgi:hypothetical protein
MLSPPGPARSSSSYPFAKSLAKRPLFDLVVFHKQVLVVDLFRPLKALANQIRKQPTAHKTHSIRSRKQLV